jgi:NAD(P)H-dependent FMN reductase
MKLAKALQKLSAGRLTFNFVDIGGLPFYDDTLWNDPPAEVIGLKREISEADAVLFVTPEYNHGPSGALKNAIDFLYTEWNDKAAGFVSYGSTGGVRAVEQLRQVMAELQIADVRSQVALSLFTVPAGVWVWRGADWLGTETSRDGIGRGAARTMLAPHGLQI